MKDYYKILGLERTATADSIKKRFHELAFENHPDVSDNKNAGEIFTEIYEAHRIISQPEQKSAYDLLYDKYIGNHKSQIPDEESLKINLQNYSYSAREKARETAGMKYRDLMKEMDCFFAEGEKADGRPYPYRMHKNIGISGGTGPMGSIKAKTVSIPVPRSKKAVKFHLAGIVIKTASLALAIFLLFTDLYVEETLLVRVLISAGIILSGGFAVMLMYHFNRVKSRFFYSRKYLLVQRYRKNGYRRGLHPMMSTTPAGVINYFFRLIF